MDAPCSVKGTIEGRREIRWRGEMRRDRTQRERQNRERKRDGSESESGSDRAGETEPGMRDTFLNVWMPGCQTPQHIYARPPLVVAGSSEAFVWVQQARCLGLMNLGDASQKPHLDRRRAAVGKAFKDLQPALRHPGSMRLRALLYRVYVVPALLYALPEASGLTD
eukprot:364467-Chlamydomonas_euryale.AAC.6